MEININVARVFVDEQGKFGNPVGIVVDTKRKLDDKKRQKIATKLNYSETVFINDLNKLNVSIFNPISEVAFSGHAILGVAFFLKQVLGRKFSEIRCGKHSVSVTEDGQLIWIVAPLAIMPPWNFKQLDTAEAVDKLTKKQLTDQEHIIIWAWIDQGKNLIRAKTFAPDWGIPEDEANGSGSMLLAVKLNKSIKVIHGRGSVIFAAPHNKKMAKVGGRITLKPMV